MDPVAPAPVARAQVMGIVNVTPDSFYDGGLYLDPDRAVSHALRLLDEGADWVDVGGESTRPGSEPVSEAEQIRRIVPVISGIVLHRPTARVSVDARVAAVAQAAIEAGASGINDESALDDPAMAPLVARTGSVLFLMHMRGTPLDMQREPSYNDVVAEVCQFLTERAGRAMAAGVPRQAIWVDPGIGFGKNDRHNAALIRGLPILAGLGQPVLVGVSRKSFIGRTLGLADPGERLEGSMALAALATWLGAAMVRVHDVLATRRAVDMVAALHPSEVGKGER